MPPLDEQLWQQLGPLCERSGMSSAASEAVRRRFDLPPWRQRLAVTLLIAQPESRLDRLLQRWLSPEAGAALQAAGDQPLVLHNGTAAMPAALADCAQHVEPAVHHMLVVAVQVSNRLPGAMATRLAQRVGYFDQAVLVSRLGHPMPKDDCTLAESLTWLCASIRVLLTGVRGELTDPEEVPELQSYVHQRLRTAGFAADRSVGADLWFANSHEPLEGVVDDLQAVLQPTPQAVRSGAAQLQAMAMEALIDEGLARAQAHPNRRLPRINEEDAQARREQLARFLSHLGEQLQQRVTDRPEASPDQVRDEALDVVTSWQYDGAGPAPWMRYCQSMRPGFAGAFLHAFQQAVTRLDIVAGPPAPPPPTTPAAPGPPSALTHDTPDLLTMGKRLALALACGLILWAFLRTLPEPLPYFQIPGLLLGAGAGYWIGSRRWPTARTEQQAAPSDGAPQATDRPTRRLVGWQRVQNQMLDWFTERFEPNETDLVQQWQQLRHHYHHLHEERAP